MQASDSVSVTKDREFANSSKVHKGKAPFHHEGCNKCPHASLALTNEGEEMLWSKGLLRGPVMEFSDSNYVVSFDAVFWITRLPGTPLHVFGRFLIHSRQQWCRVSVCHIQRKLISFDLIWFVHVIYKIYGFFRVFAL